MTPIEFEISVEKKCEVGIGSGETIELSLDYEEENILKCLRCVIKMTEFTPISGGNISELNKILDLFLNKRSLLVLRNNDNKWFLCCYIKSNNKE